MKTHEKILLGVAVLLLVCGGCARQPSQAAEYELSQPPEPTTYRAPEPNPPRLLAGGATEVNGTDGAKATPRGTVPVPGWQSLAVVLLTPMLIAWLRKKFGINKKYLAVLAPVIGELLSQLFAALPAGIGALSGLAGTGVRQIKHDLLAKTDQGPAWPRAQMPTIAFAAVLCLASGCAVTRTVQEDSFYDKEGKLNRRQTKTLAMSVWDALAKLGGFNATQSDRTQTTKIANASGESTATNLVTISGNAVELVKLFVPGK